MKTKRLIILGLLLLVVGMTVSSQNTWYSVFVGDTVNLSFTGANDSIQWQESEDSLLWTNMIGYTNNTETIIVTSSITNKKFYKVKMADSFCPSSTIRLKIIANLNEVQVGNGYRGGIVFYTDGTGHGLMATPQDQGVFQYGCKGTITHAISITNGALNTTTIVSACADRPIAASICDSLTKNGNNDWYLPAQDQLNSLYQQKNLVGGFSPVWYWSSTEELNPSYGDEQATLQLFSGTYEITTTNKDWPANVRCIRSFTPSDRAITYCTTSITNNQAVNILTQPNSQIKCFGSNVIFSVSTSGTMPISYQWKKNGVDIPNANGANFTKNYLSAADEGIYTCVVSNMCRSITSNGAELKVIELSANAGEDIVICNGETTQLQAIGISNYTIESGSLIYSWNPSSSLTNASISNPFASPNVNTTYNVTVTDQHGCYKTDQINVTVSNVYQNQVLCIVGVSATNKNLLVWNKPVYTSINFFRIYKETNQSNIYQPIGDIDYNYESIFIDTTSSPSIQSNKYKIAVIDTCGNESSMSAPHKTMHLSLNQGMNNVWNLIWDPYEGFTVTTYNVYRGTNPDDLQLIGTSSGSNTQYSDFSAPVGYVYYQIEVVSPNICNPSKSYNTSRSNKATNNPQGINDILTDNTFNIYPNPATDEIIIEILQNNNINIATCEINNSEGQLIRKLYLKNQKTKIDVKELNSGFYTIKVKSDNEIMIKKLVKQ